MEYLREKNGCEVELLSIALTQITQLIKPI